MITKGTKERMTKERVATELSDAEIEAIVAAAIADDAARTSAEAQPPSSAIVWWRAQMRARQDAALLAERPITIVHALSIAAGIGLMLSVVGYAVAGVKGSTAWLAALWPSIVAAAGPLSVELFSRWLPLMLTVGVVSVIVTSIAAYVIYADE
ncbi:MAG TPA: hypothetical protein VGI12_03815 [Vicinamibacterales bacterium]|jgi:hypothetical protein